MAEIYNPWQQPPSDSTLSHAFVTEEYEAQGNEMSGDMMAQAMQVINQQSQLIKQLLSKLTEAKKDD